MFGSGPPFSTENTSQTTQEDPQNLRTLRAAPHRAFLKPEVSRRVPPQASTPASPAGRSSQNLVLDLRGLGSLQACLPFRPRDIELWMDRRLPLLLSPSVLGEATRTRASSDRSVLDHHHPQVRAWLDRGEGFTFHSLWRGKRGGRLYPYWMPVPPRRLCSSRRVLDGAPGKLLLSCLTKVTRRHLASPNGFDLVELDVRSCHAAIGAALSGDLTLASEVAIDIHELTGRRVQHHLRQGPGTLDWRGVGKSVNMVLLFGGGEAALRHRLAECFSLQVSSEWAGWFCRTWWETYPRLYEFRRRVEALVQQGQREGRGLVVVSPSGWRNVFDHWRLQGNHPVGERTDPANVWRTVFSSCFRTVEGDLMLALYRRLDVQGEHEARPALPLYDGGLFHLSSKAASADRASLLHAFRSAAMEVGVPTAHASITPTTTQEGPRGEAAVDHGKQPRPSPGSFS